MKFIIKIHTLNHEIASKQSILIMKLLPKDLGHFWVCYNYKDIAIINYYSHFPINLQSNVLGSGTSKYLGISPLKIFASCIKFLCTYKFFRAKIIFNELCESCTFCVSNFAPLNCIENLAHPEGSRSHVRCSIQGKLYMTMLCKDVDRYTTCLLSDFPIGTLLWKVSQILEGLLITN